VAGLDARDSRTTDQVESFSEKGYAEFQASACRRIILLWCSGVMAQWQDQNAQ